MNAAAVIAWCADEMRYPGADIIGVAKDAVRFLTAVCDADEFAALSRHLIVLVRSQRVINA